MKKSRFTEPQIVDALKRNENDQAVAYLASELGITPATFYAWRKKYAGMNASRLKRLKELEAENAKLKKMYAELDSDNVAPKDVVSKK